MRLRHEHFCTYKPASFQAPPSFLSLSVRKSGRGPGIFSHMSDVRIERMVERVWLWVGARGPEQQKEPTYHVIYCTYLTTGGWLLYTPSIECVVSWTIRETQSVSSENFRHFSIMSCSREKRYQALPAFSYCKQQKAGPGLGTRLLTNHTCIHSLIPRPPGGAWEWGYCMHRYWLACMYVA